MTTTDDANEPVRETPKSDKPRKARKYEFDSREEIVIGQLASAMKFVGSASIALGVLMALGALGSFLGSAAALAMGQAIQATLFCVIGAWTRGAASHFQLVVDTKGADISNMMNALEELRRVYALQRALLMIALVVIAVGSFYVIMVGSGLRSY